MRQVRHEVSPLGQAASHMVLRLESYVLLISALADTSH